MSHLGQAAHPIIAIEKHNASVCHA